MPHFAYYKYPHPADSAAWVAGEEISRVFFAMDEGTRNAVVGAMDDADGWLLAAIGNAVHCFGSVGAPKQIARHVAYAVYDGEAAELVETLPNLAPWSVIKAGLGLAIDRGVDLKEFENCDPYDGSTWTWDRPGRRGE